MKNQKKMSFKRVKSRSTSVNLNKIKLIRSLFAVKLSKEITVKTLLIHIDESSINKFVKTNYSWGCKGKPIEWKNSSFTGSISWILAICSNGSWLCMLVSNIIDSVSFIWFINILSNWIKSNDNFKNNEVAIMLDNWSVHKSQLSQILFKKHTFKILYILAYSGELAPIEMSFSLLKRNQSSSNKNQSVKLFFK